MHKRITNSFSGKEQLVLEDIPGVEIRIVQLLDKLGVNRYSRDFLIMSTGVIYVRPTFYTENKNQKWRYLHDDTLVGNLAGDRVYLINNFRNACLESTNRHLVIYEHLFENADKNHNVIKKSINNFAEEMSHHYSKIGISAFYGNQRFEPWI